MYIDRFLAMAASFALLLIQPALGATNSVQDPDLDLPHSLAVRAPGREVKSTCTAQRTQSTDWWALDDWAEHPFTNAWLDLRIDEGWGDICDDRISQVIAEECALVLARKNYKGTVQGIQTQLEPAFGICAVDFLTTSNPNCALYALCHLETHGLIPRKCVAWEDK